MKSEAGLGLDQLCLSVLLSHFDEEEREEARPILLDVADQAPSRLAQRLVNHLLLLLVDDHHHDVHPGQVPADNVVDILGGPGRQLSLLV